MRTASGRVSNVVVTKPAINLYYKQSSVLIPCNLPAVVPRDLPCLRRNATSSARCRFLATRFQFNSLPFGRENR